MLSGPVLRSIADLVMREAAQLGLSLLPPSPSSRLAQLFGMASVWPQFSLNLTRVFESWVDCPSALITGSSRSNLRISCCPCVTQRAGNCSTDTDSTGVKAAAGLKQSIRELLARSPFGAFDTLKHTNTRIERSNTKGWGQSSSSSFPSSVVSEENQFRIVGPNRTLPSAK